MATIKETLQNIIDRKNSIISKLNNKGLAILSSNSKLADIDSALDKITGKPAQTYYVDTTSDRTIGGGNYIQGAQIIKGVKIGLYPSTADNALSLGSSPLAISTVLSSAVAIRIGDSDNKGRLLNIQGTFTKPGTDEIGATASDILSGKVAWVNGSKITGTITSKVGKTYTVDTSDRTISAGQYLSGAQIIKGVNFNLYTSTADNALLIKGTGIVSKEQMISSLLSPSVAIRIGDSDNSGRLLNVQGTFTVPETDEIGATASDILSGKVAWVNGSKITGTGRLLDGNIVIKEAQTYYPSTSDQTISADQYLSGDQVIKAVKTTNILADNIRKGVRAKVGDESNLNRIINVLGTLESCDERYPQRMANTSYCDIDFLRVNKEDDPIFHEATGEPRKSYFKYYRIKDRSSFSYNEFINKNVKVGDTVGYFIANSYSVEGNLNYLGLSLYFIKVLMIDEELERITLIFKDEIYPNIPPDDSRLYSTIVVDNNYENYIEFKTRLCIAMYRIDAEKIPYILNNIDIDSDGDSDDVYNNGSGWWI